MFVKPQTLLKGMGKYARLYLKPYFITCFIFLIIEIANSILHGNNVYLLFIKWIKQTLFGSGWSYGSEMFATTPAIGCIWFLLALFWAELFYSTIKRVNSNLEQCLWIFGLFVFAVFSVRYIRLPFSLQPGMSAVLFLWVGDLIVTYNVLEKVKKLGPITKVTFILFMLMVTLRHNGVSTATTYYRPVLCMVPASIIWCVVIFVFFKRYNIRSGWVGKNTLCILCGHKLVGSIFSLIGYNSADLTYTPQINFVIELCVSMTTTLLLGLFLYKSAVMK